MTQVNSNALYGEQYPDELSNANPVKIDLALAGLILNSRRDFKRRFFVIATPIRTDIVSCTATIKSENKHIHQGIGNE